MIILITFFTPIVGKPAGTGGGEDGLAEAFEEGWNFIQPFLTGFNLGKKFFQFGDDAVLFSGGWHGYFNAVNILSGDAGYCGGLVMSAKP